MSIRRSAFRLRLSGVLWLLFWSCLLPAQDGGGRSATATAVDQSFNQREIKVRAGCLIRVSLEELGAAGYQWEARELDTEHFEITDVRTGSVPGDEVTGAPVVKTWTIRSKVPGESMLRFSHQRPWEGERTASGTFVLKVCILP